MRGKPFFALLLAGMLLAASNVWAACEYDPSYCGGMSFSEVLDNRTTLSAGECVFITTITGSIQPNGAGRTWCFNNVCLSDWGNWWGAGDGNFTSIPQADGGYYVHYRAGSGSGNYNVSAGTKNPECAAQPLTGDISIHGTLHLNETVSVDIAGSNIGDFSSSDIAYAWTIGAASVCGNSSTCTIPVDAAHVGGTISVTATGSGTASGSLSASSASTIAKAIAAPPASPTFDAEEDDNPAPNAIVLALIPNGEYMCEECPGVENTWQSSPSFTGLTPSTAYTFYQRTVETSTHLQSEPSVSASISTIAAGAPPLAGTASIANLAGSNPPEVGDVLRASFAAADLGDYEANLLCTWRRGGSVVQGPSADCDYAIQPADFGSVISVRFTAPPARSGFVENLAPLAAVVKKTQSAPSAIPSGEATPGANTITLSSYDNSLYDYGYKKATDPAITWISEGAFTGTFSGLAVGVEYFIYRRFAESETYYASAESDLLSISTIKPPAQIYYILGINTSECNWGQSLGARLSSASGTLIGSCSNNIGTVINVIRDNAQGADVTIYFGNDAAIQAWVSGSRTFTTTAMTFETGNGNDWGDITLRGSLLTGMRSGAKLMVFNGNSNINYDVSFTNNTEGPAGPSAPVIVNNGSGKFVLTGDPNMAGLRLQTTAGSLGVDAGYAPTVVTNITLSNPSQGAIGVENGASYAANFSLQGMSGYNLDPSAGHLYLRTGGTAWTNCAAGLTLNTAGGPPGSCAYPPLNATANITVAGGGSFTVGQTLEVSLSGSQTNIEPPVTYIWKYHNNSDVSDVGTQITACNDQTTCFLTKATDGKYISVSVAGGNGTATGQTGQINPLNITGTAEITSDADGGAFIDGATLTATLDPEAVPPAASYVYQWQKCDADGTSNCSDVGSDQNTYGPLVEADVGYVFTVAIGTDLHTGTANGQSLAIAHKPLIGTPTISETNPRIGDVLSATLEGPTSNTGTLHCVWKVNDVQPDTGADNCAGFTVLATHYASTTGMGTEAEDTDANAAITVEISSSKQTGSLASDPTEPILKQVALAAPAKLLDADLTVTDTQIEVDNPNSSYEYKLTEEDNTIVKDWSTSSIFDELEDGTIYLLYQRVAATASQYASEPSEPLEVLTEAGATTLTGSVRINGVNPTGLTPRYGDELTASLETTIEETLDLSYQWLADGEIISSETDETFTPVLAKIALGAEISVRISAAGYDNSLTSPRTQGLIKKAGAASATAPTLDEATATSITLDLVPGYEYSIDNGDNWQDSPEFTGLTPNTEYAFIQRIKETADTEHSANSISQTFSTNKTNLTGTVDIAGTARIGETLTANYTPGNATSALQYEWLWSSGEIIQGKSTDNEYVLLESDYEKNITVIVTTDNELSSVSPASLVGPVGKRTVDAPAPPTIIHPAIYVTTTTITLEPIPGYEYAYNVTGIAPAATDAGWQSSSEFTGLSAGTLFYFFQRIAETTYSEASPASNSLMQATKREATAVPPALAAANLTPTSNSITVNSDVANLELYQYGYRPLANADAEIIWVEGNAIIGLAPATEYTIFRRYRATELQGASNPSAGLDAATLAAVAGTYVITNYNAVTPPAGTGTVTGANITALINNIRNHAVANNITDVTLQFGASSSWTLDFNANSNSGGIVFENSGGNIWGNITLTGAVSFQNAPAANPGAGVTVRDGVNLTLGKASGSGHANTFTAGTNSDLTWLQNAGNGTVTVNQATFPQRTAENATSRPIVHAGSGKTIINGGSFTSNNAGRVILATAASSGEIIIRGGSFTLNSNTANRAALHIASGSTVAVEITGGAMNIANHPVVQNESSTAKIAIGGSPAISRIAAPASSLPITLLEGYSRSNVIQLALTGTPTHGDIAIAKGVVHSSTSGDFTVSAPSGWNLQPRGSHIVFQSGSTTLEACVLPDEWENRACVTALTGAPIISKADPRIGDVLSVEPGTLNLGGNSINSYVWKADGVQVGTGPTYAVSENDLTKTISVTVTVTNRVGEATATAEYPVQFAAISGIAIIDNMEPIVGNTLTASLDGGPSVSLSYVWRRHAAEGDAGTEVGWSASYNVAEEDVGKLISVSISAFGFAPKTSEKTSAVKWPPLYGTASILGNVLDPRVGDELTALIAGGPLDGVPVYTWQRYNAAGDAFVEDIAGAVNEKYELTADDIGYKIAVAVGMTKYHGSAISNLTASVTVGAVTIAATANDPRVGETLTANYNGHATDLSYEWRRYNGATFETIGTNLATYTVEVGDFGKQVAVAVSSIGGDFAGKRESEKTAVVRYPDLDGTVAITGDAVVTETLVANASISNAYGTLIYDWVVGGESKQKSSSDAYSVVAADFGKQIKVIVTVDGQPGIIESALTAAVVYPEFEGAIAIVSDEAFGTLAQPRIGDGLSVNLVGLSNLYELDKLVYSWKADGVEVGTGSSYTIATTDFGKIIAVTVTSSVQNGEASDALAAEAKKKINIQTPDALTVAFQVTHNRIRLHEIDFDGYEYSMDNVNWHSASIFTGLEPATSYTFYQRIAEIVDTEASISSSGFIVATNAAPTDPIDGSVVITGYVDNPRVGDVLAVDAVVNAFDPLDEEIFYTWKVNGEPKGGEETYAVTAADVGYEITVEIGAEFKLGELSATTPVVLKQVAPAAPGAPTLDGSPTNTSITLAAHLGYEYSKDGGDSWQDENVFGSLTPNREYVFVQRVKETPERYESAISPSASFWTDKNPKPATAGKPELEEVTHNSVTLVAVSGYEYSKDNGVVWQSSNVFEGLSSDTEYTFCQRIAADEDTYEADASEGLTVRTLKGIAGTLSIAGYIGSPRIGNTLTANIVGGGSNTGTLSYKWEIGGQVVSNGATYVVTLEDLGETIKVTVTSDVEIGELSATTSEVLKKINTATVLNPEVVSKTHNSVTLIARVGYEYSKDNGLTWQDENMFEGLDSETEYFFRQRIKETEDTEASVTRVLSVITNSDPNVSTLPQFAAGNIIAKAIGNNIVLENLPKNAKVEVYNLQGKHIFNGQWTMNNGQLKIPVQTNGIYVVKVNKQTLRIAVR